MKKLVAFTAFLAAGFLLGSRRARTNKVAVEFTTSGSNLVGVLNLHNDRLGRVVGS